MTLGTWLDNKTPSAKLSFWKLERLSLLQRKSALSVASWP
jgi:hypothetical protein